MMIFGSKCVSLIEHPVFDKLACAIEYQVDQIKIANKPKQRMTQAFLKSYFRVFQQELKKFVGEDGHNSPLDFIVMYNEIIERITKDALASGIPGVFLSKFNDLRAPQIKSAYSSMESINGSQFYVNYDAKITAMLDVCLCDFVYLTLEAEHALAALNGQVEAALAGSIFEIEE